MLLSGCCAVSDTPAVWQWARSIHDFGFLQPSRSLMSRAHRRRAARELGDLFEEVVVHVPEERDARRERVGVDAALHGALEVAERAGEGERRLPDGGRAGVAHVVAADADRVEARHHGGAYSIVSTTSSTDASGGKMNSFCAVYSLRMSFCVVPVSTRRRCRALRRRRSTSPITPAGALIVSEVDTSSSGMPSNSACRVDDGVDGDADLADLAPVDRVVGVEAEQRRQVEVGRQAGLAVGEQVLVAAVGVFGLAEPGDLADRPRPAAVHRRVGAAGVGVLAREAEVALLVEVLEVGARVEVLDRKARQRRVIRRGGAGPVRSPWRGARSSIARRPRP